MAEHARSQITTIGRVEKHQVKRPPGAGAKLERVSLEASGRDRCAETPDVPADHCTCSRVIVDEMYRGGSPGQCFEPQRTRTCESVQHANPGDAVPEATVQQQVEHVLPDPARGRPEPCPAVSGTRFRQARQVRSTEPPANDFHRSKAFRLLLGSEMVSRFGVLPASMRRLPTMYDMGSFIASTARRRFFPKYQ